jgi:hypothetical protein
VGGDPFGVTAGPNRDDVPADAEGVDSAARHRDRLDVHHEGRFAAFGHRLALFLLRDRDR